MRALLVVSAVFGLAESAIAQERFVERTPLPRTPPVHSMERAGNPVGVSRFAQPSTGQHDAGGYVGGARLFGNRPLARGVGVVTGPTTTGTFGTDYVGVKDHPGRVFLTPSYDPSVGPTLARSYRTDGRYPPDVFALRPFRKAVLEQRKDAEEGKVGDH